MEIKRFHAAGSKSEPWLLHRFPSSLGNLVAVVQLVQHRLQLLSSTLRAKGALAEKSTGPQQVSGRHSRRDVSAPPENEVLLAGDQVPRQDPAQTSDRGKLKVGSILRGKDGTEWRVIKTGDEMSGRKGSHNVLRDVPGPSPHAKRNVDDTARSAWGLFFTDSMLKRIQLCTETEARKSGNKEWSISVEELEAFLAILYARGAYGLASRSRD